MRWFQNQMISTKLVIGFIIVACITAITGAIGVFNINSMADASHELYEENTVSIDYMSKIYASYLKVRKDMAVVVLTDNESLKTTSMNAIRENIVATDDYIAQYELNIHNEEDDQQLSKLQTQWIKYKELIENTLQQMESQKNELALNSYVSNVGKIEGPIQEVFEHIEERNSMSAMITADSNMKQATTATIIMAVVAVSGVAIAVLLGTLIARIISRPIKQIALAADKLSVGDVDISFDIKTKDEIGILARSFESMAHSIRKQALVAEKIAQGDLTVEVEVRSENDLLGKKLKEMVEQNNEIFTNLTTASQQVAVGASQISDGSITLSQGATEQASSIEELTASLEEIAAQTSHTAENANKVNDLAIEAKQSAEQGNIRMNEMLKAMEEINEASTNISKIIKVIDGIAFQTNILALNAAVEAARAGQQGKGFAVVADEVRNLAARSANAANETTAMIESSLKKVENGTKIAKETAEALNVILTDVDIVVNLVDEINVASNEQATGISQLNQGIIQVAEVIQANSATSEEGAAASEELSSQAMLLKDMVSRFKLKQVKETTFVNKAMA